MLCPECGYEMILYPGEDDEPDVNECPDDGTVVYS